MQEYLQTRRWFLQRGLGLLVAGGTVPTFLNQTVRALTNAADGALTQAPSGKDGKILVIVQLSGGNDGLNTIIPWADDAYHRSRPGLAIAPKDALRLNDYLGMHPNLAPLKELYDDGLMSIVQGVGYPNPNRSHFRSMDIWHTARPEEEFASSGWLGRYFDATCEGEDPHAGISIGDSLPLAMQGERIRPLAFERPESYRYNGRDQAHYRQLNSIRDMAAVQTPQATRAQDARSADDPLDFLTRTAMDAQVSSDNITRMVRGHQPSVQYPGGSFGQGLRTIASMIAGGLPTRVYYVSLGGFDTHAQQRGRHDNLMQQFAQGISAFWADLKYQKNDDRVTIMSFSEFGRRVAANASGGTDHGAAAPMFLFSRHLKQGIVGPHPSLTDLDQGDLKHHIDFRSVYTTLLQRWLDTPAAPILGRSFMEIDMLKRV